MFIPFKMESQMIILHCSHAVKFLIDIKKDEYRKLKESNSVKLHFKQTEMHTYIF